MRSRSQALPALVVSILLALPGTAHPCTVFSVDSHVGRLVGKSFDWSTGDGWLVANERGRTRRALAPGGAFPASWTAHYASLSLSTIGPGFPISGMNEAGLVVESLVDSLARTTTSMETGKPIHLELAQYALDTFSTARDFADFVEAIGFTQLVVPLHLFACDRSGDCIVVESRGVTRNISVRTLANGAYAEELGSTSSRPSKLGLLPGIGCGDTTLSGDRFCRASYAAPRDEVEGMATLANLRVPGLTQWSLIWNQDAATLTFRRSRTEGGPVTVRLLDAPEGCTGMPRVRALSALDHPFVEWSARDRDVSETSVIRQAGRSLPEMTHLARRVALATMGSPCVSP